jgi:hypothetical protein
MYLSLAPTLTGLALCLGLFFIARWRSGQPVRPERGPRLIPWTLIAIISAAMCVALVVHLVELAGMDPAAFRPRRM